MTVIVSFGRDLAECWLGPRPLKTLCYLPNVVQKSDH